MLRCQNWKIQFQAFICCVSSRFSLGCECLYQVINQYTSSILADHCTVTHAMYGTGRTIIFLKIVSVTLQTESNIRGISLLPEVLNGMKQHAS